MGFEEATPAQELLMAAHFLTFADRRYQASVDRLMRQARAMDAFETVVGLTEDGLSPAFRQQFGGVLRRDVRGFGYWVWKPQIIADALTRLPEGDVLLYADAGCHLNPRGRGRLLDYLATTGEGPAILVFEMVEHTIARWTKGDLLQHFGVSLDDPVVQLPQVWAGAIVIRNCSEAHDFVSAWRQAFDLWHLVDDSPSRYPNHPTFTEHRHDQSVLSLLARERLVRIWSHREQYPPSDGSGQLDWSALDRFPLHCRRDLQSDLWSLRCRRWLRLRRFGVLRVLRTMGFRRS